MINPRSLVPQSIMPAYSFLAEATLNTEYTVKKMQALLLMGVPYSKENITASVSNLTTQSAQIASALKNEGENVANENSELIALISYLQRLGTDSAAAAKNKEENTK